MSTPTQPARFVNLTHGRVHIQDQAGRTIVVQPFRESLNEFSRRADGLYVLEGEWWSRYVSAAGPLSSMPEPAQFALDAFPAYSGAQVDRRVVAGPAPAVAPGAVAAQALPGVFRGAGDVITAEGKIKRWNPVTQRDELLDDIPENRNMHHPLHDPKAVVDPDRDRIREGIIAWLEEEGIETIEQFDARTDADLMRIPGVGAHNIAKLRTGIRKLLVNASREVTMEQTQQEAPPVRASSMRERKKKRRATKRSDKKRVN